MTLSLQKNKSLKALNTFGFDQRAALYATAKSEQDIEQAVDYARSKNLPLLVLGEGSNVVLANDVSGLVLRLTDERIHIDWHNDDVVEVSASAGVSWHALVQYTLGNNIQGLENLSLIPGSVGAAPVQNVGAYGVEVQDRICKVRAFHIPTRQWLTLRPEQCQFSYRHSLFKQHADEYIISEVVFSLGRQHALQTDYASLAQHLASRNITRPTAQQISESVIAIRQSKLPDPNVIGNAGSFFHNPIVDAVHHEALLEQYPELSSYPQTDGSFKLAAGWLIDKLGFKGTVCGGVGVHADQALVLVNVGSGTGADILRLAEKIKTAVRKAYAVELNIEPRVI